MVKTPSTMLPLGTAAPDFALPEPAGEGSVSLDDVRSDEGFLVAFVCNHCPFVKHIADELAAFGAEYGEKGLGVVAISSNDAAGYPADGPDEMAEEARRRGYTFPYLYDEDQSVAKAYRAACTPDFFLFDGNGLLVYRGQFDGSRPGNGVPVTGEDLRAAADAVLAGQEPVGDQTPSVGCNIKWKDGNAPAWFG